MKHKFIVANWKSYKTLFEAKNWFKLWYEKSSNISDLQDKEIIICPPFPIIPSIYDLIMNNSSSDKLMLKLSSQDVSSFTEGAYTGEVSARLLAEFCSYSIIGHSERRQYLKENNEMLFTKVDLALQFNLKPIYCVQGMETEIPEGVKIVAFEPIWAIGSGKPDTPDDAEEMAIFLKEKRGINYVLYGGSVIPENVSSFTSMDHIDGVLVGGASRDPDKFVQIVNNA